jgi:hypothetical protein
MNLTQFNSLPDEQQLTLVYAEGAYVATRWQEVYEAVLLYQLPGGFFVELTYDTETSEVQYLYAFEAGGKGDRLPDYVMFVKLPDWLPAVE